MKYLKTVLLLLTSAHLIGCATTAPPNSELKVAVRSALKSNPGKLHDLYRTSDAEGKKRIISEVVVSGFNNCSLSALDFLTEEKIKFNTEDSRTLGSNIVGSHCWKIHQKALKEYPYAIAAGEYWDQMSDEEAAEFVSDLKSTETLAENQCLAKDSEACDIRGKVTDNLPKAEERFIKKKEAAEFEQSELKEHQQLDAIQKQKDEDKKSGKTDLVVACNLTNQIKFLRDSIEREKRNPSGYVNKVNLYNTGHAIQLFEDQLVDAKAGYKQKTGKDFDSNNCGKRKSISYQIDSGGTPVRDEVGE